MIALIDIGTGNINSISKALDYLELTYCIAKNPDDFDGCSKIVFPGVGSFDVASENLTFSGLKDKIRYEVLEEKKPFLGICLGMQLIAKKSEEGKPAKGLELLDAEIKRIPEKADIKIPHIGWNNVDHDQSVLFKGIKSNADFYFVHSYRMVPNDKSIKVFYTEYGEKLAAYIENENIFGTQFHPEKSQSDGLILLKNFSNLC